MIVPWWLLHPQEQRPNWPCAFTYGSIILAPGLLTATNRRSAECAQEHHPLPGMGWELGTWTQHPLTWKTLGAETRQASAEERVAPKIPAVMRGPNPDTMLMLCPKTRRIRSPGTPSTNLHSGPEGFPAPGPHPATLRAFPLTLFRQQSAAVSKSNPK